MNVYDDIFGQLIGERYRVVRRLGAGAFGQVFEASHEIFAVPLRAVALKLFTKGFVTQSNARKIFKEALMLEALAAAARARGEETHLVAVYDIGVLRDYQGIPYVAMEFVNGGSLEDRLEKRGLPLQTVIRYARAICAGLALAHRASLVHRDLKPANVLITQNGFIKVADFGVAVDRYEAFVGDGGGGGDVNYAPPECSDGGEVSPAYDVYSVGVTMLEMLLGRNPLAGILRKAKDDRAARARELGRAWVALSKLQDPETGRPFGESLAELCASSNFRNLLARCLALNPQSRFADAQALDEALKLCEGDDEGDGTVEPPEETFAQKVSRLLTAARRQLRLGDLDNAEKLFCEVVDLDLRNPQPHFGLADVFERREQFAAAAEAQKAGTNLQRTREGLNRLADLYEKAGKSADASVARLLAKRAEERRP